MKTQIFNTISHWRFKKMVESESTWNNLDLGIASVSKHEISKPN
jgi:hypothetical protein